MTEFIRRLAQKRQRESLLHAQRGYVAVLMSMVVASGLFMAAAAVAVDTGRWYVTMESVQKAADAAALGGVPFLPYDFPKAEERAKQIAARNGFPEGEDTVIKVELGNLASQLRVTITTRVKNVFGASFGVGSTVVHRTGMADYKGAAPMGSPCNTFGNEPPPGAGSPSPSPKGTARDSSVTGCTSAPMMWGGVQGAQTNKSNGDRYQNELCNLSGTDGCGVKKSNVNDEYNEWGYNWIVRVAEGAVGKAIDLQIYDAPYINTGVTCGIDSSQLSNNMNSFVTTDGKLRYSKAISGSNSSTGSPFCNGDSKPEGASTSSTLKSPVTSFILREQTDTMDPKKALPIVGCTKQFRGTNTAPTVDALKEFDSNGNVTKKYNEHLAMLFHNWYSLCTFTPDRPGDYYIQVRTNVEFGGKVEKANTNGFEAMVSTGNAAAQAETGTYRNTAFMNTFSFRAVVPGYQEYVSVSGYQSMPIFANDPGATTSTFHLIRILPGAAGQQITFSFFDVADAGGTTGKVAVLPPSDATGTIKTNPFPGNCTTAYGINPTTWTPLSNCTTTITDAKNNKKLQQIRIPIPPDYNCTYSKNWGCWYKVAVSLSGGVRDFTTWEASVVGDPVRLIE